MSKFATVTPYNTEKLIAIDIFKCGILLIILCHMSFFLNFSIVESYPSLKADFWAPTLANIGLSMFIFASGYTLASRYKSLENREAINQYFKKRVIRIYPIWWIGLLLEFIIFEIFNLNPDPYTENFSVMGLLYLLTGVHGFFKADVEIGGGHIDWFVGAILIYYIIYAIIAKYARDDIEILIISLIIYIVCYMYHVLDPRFYLYYPVFLIGIFAGRYDILKITQSYFLQIPQSIQGIIRFIAQSSYATYVIHQPLLSVVKYYDKTSGITGLREVLVILIASPVVIIIAYCIQKWISGLNYSNFSRSIIQRNIN